MFKKVYAVSQLSETPYWASLILIVPFTLNALKYVVVNVTKNNLLVLLLIKCHQSVTNTLLPVYYLYILLKKTSTNHLRLLGLRTIGLDLLVLASTHKELVVN